MVILSEHIVIMLLSLEKVQMSHLASCMKNGKMQILCCFYQISSSPPLRTFEGRAVACWGDTLWDCSGNLSASRLPAACKEVEVGVLASHCPQQSQLCSTDKWPDKPTECKRMCRSTKVIRQAVLMDFLVWQCLSAWLSWTLLKLHDSVSQSMHTSYTVLLVCVL